MNDDHCQGHCVCGDNTLTREEALEQAFGFLVEASAHVTSGRTTEASVMNGLAQTAIALAERIQPAIANGPIH